MERAQRRLGETSLVLCAAAPFLGAVAISCGCRSRATAFLRSSGAPVTLRRGNDGFPSAGHQDAWTFEPGRSDRQVRYQFLELPLCAQRNSKSIGRWLGMPLIAGSPQVFSAAYTTRGLLLRRTHDIADEARGVAGTSGPTHRSIHIPQTSSPEVCLCPISLSFPYRISGGRISSSFFGEGIGDRESGIGTKRGNRRGRQGRRAGRRSITKTTQRCDWGSGNRWNVRNRANRMPACRPAQSNLAPERRYAARIRLTIR